MTLTVMFQYPPPYDVGDIYTFVILLAFCDIITQIYYVNYNKLIIATIKRLSNKKRLLGLKWFDIYLKKYIFIVTH